MMGQHRCMNRHPSRPSPRGKHSPRGSDELIRRFTIRGLGDFALNEGAEGIDFRGDTLGITSFSGQCSSTSLGSESTDSDDVDINAKAVERPYIVVSSRALTSEVTGHQDLGALINEYMKDHIEIIESFFSTEFRNMKAVGAFRAALGFRRRDIWTSLVMVISLVIATIVLWVVHSNANRIKQELQDGLRVETQMNMDANPVVMALSKHVIPYGETPYSRFCRCHDVKAPKQKRQHVIRIDAVTLSSLTEPSLTPGLRFVRSITLFDAGEDEISYCTTETNIRYENHACSDYANDGNLRLLWQWSPNSKTSFHLPPNAGILLRGQRVRRFVLQVEYDLTTIRKGLWKMLQPQDDTGVRLHITQHLRPQNAAVLEVGSLAFNLDTGKECEYVVSSHQLDFRANVIKSPVTVFGVSTKSRGLSHMAILSIVRGAQEIGTWNMTALSTTEDVPRLVHDVKLPADRSKVALRINDTITLQCVYNTTLMLTNIQGGFAPHQELCLGFLYVYPAESLLVETLTHSKVLLA